MSRRLLLMSLLLCPAASLAAPDGALLEALRWRNIGPFRGGRVTTVAGVPGQPLVYYQATGGVGKRGRAIAGNVSTDFRTDPFEDCRGPSDPNVIYVGMGEACIRSNFSHGDGVYRSTDAGNTWSHLGLSDTRQIGKIRITPRPGRIYVAAVGAPQPQRARALSLQGQR
jgi:hypothetical protein